MTFQKPVFDFTDRPGFPGGPIDRDAQRPVLELGDRVTDGFNIGEITQLDNEGHYLFRYEKWPGETETKWCKAEELQLKPLPVVERRVA